MGKIALRLLFIISITFNLAFLTHLFFISPKSEAGGNMITELRISGEQEKKIRSASTLIDRENHFLTAKIAELQHQLIESLQEPQVDKKKVFQFIKEINAKQQKIQENTVKKILVYKEHLSNDQCSCFMDHMCKKMRIDPQHNKKSCKSKK